MGDDYDSLCVDMLDELNGLFSDNGQKASRAIKQIERSLAIWNQRRADFEKYRRKYGQ